MPKLKLDQLIVHCFSGTWGGTRLKGLSRPGRSGSTALTVFCLLMFISSQAFAGSKLAPELRQGKSGKSVDVIVQYKADPTDDQIGKVARKGAALKHKFSVVQ